jgi:hypothetical protein
MWEYMLVGFIIALFIPFGMFLDGLVCFGMGITNIPGFLLWKSSRTNKSMASICGVILGWLGQTAISLVFCTLLVMLVRLIMLRLPVAQIFVWLLWGMAFFTAIRPSFMVLKVVCNDQDKQVSASYVFAFITSIFTLPATGIGFLLLALFMP